MRYEIPEENIDTLRDKLKKIEKKCAKYNNSFSYSEVGEIFRDVSDIGSSESVYRKYIIVEVEGRAIINDWEFLATLEHTDNGNIIRTYSNNVSIPEFYRTCKQSCDHCHTNRYRKDTFLIRNRATGDIKQVGRDCLNDYTQGMSANDVAAVLEYIHETEEFSNPSLGAIFDKYFRVTYIIKIAICLIDKYGFTSRSKCEQLGEFLSETTASHILFYIERSDCFFSADELEELDKKMSSEFLDSEVSKIVEWLNSQNSDSNYISNLTVLCKNEFCEQRDFGLLASLPAAYNKEIEKQKEKSYRLTSVHVGNIGDKIVLDNTRIKYVTSYETNYGVTNIFEFIKGGNIFIWKTGKYIDTDRVKTCSVKGTIKAHTEFKNMKQTELTRCRVF
jgi:hypothetical protein